MLADPESKLAGEENGQLILNTAAAWTFIHKCDSVNQKLALLAFLTAGQTPRVTEFMDHKYANSTRPRTIFRDTSYYRQTLTTKKDKTTALHALVNMLFRKCVVCWAYQETIIPSHTQLWIACQATRAYVPI